MTDAGSTAVSSPVRPTVRPGSLAGERVCFTGGLAMMTRQEAARLTASAGGRAVAAMSSRVSLLVVGERGWPLLEDGRATRKLAAADRLRRSGSRLRIVSESAFREKIGLDTRAAEAEKPIDAAVAAASVGVDAATLERWVQLGLVRPHDGRYDFRDLVSLRTISDLVARGVSPVTIRRSLQGLAGVLPGVDRPLAQLSIISESPGSVRAELGDALLAPDGQLEMRFDRPASELEVTGPVAIRADRGGEPSAWVARGLESEAQGRQADAERSYRRAIELDPADAAAQFNLGNVLLTLGRPAAAAERFAQAAALDPGMAIAWFNLAHARDEEGRAAEAAEALRSAIAADPAYADAYFNLADLCERLGRGEEAVQAWDGYLRLDPSSDWGSEARQRLGALRRGRWA